MIESSVTNPRPGSVLSPTKQGPIWHRLHQLHASLDSTTSGKGQSVSAPTEAQGAERQTHRAGGEILEAGDPGAEDHTDVRSAKMQSSKLRQPSKKRSKACEAEDRERSLRSEHKPRRCLAAALCGLCLFLCVHHRRWRPGAVRGKPLRQRQRGAHAVSRRVLSLWRCSSSPPSSTRNTKSGRHPPPHQKSWNKRSQSGTASTRSVFFSRQEKRQAALQAGWGSISTCVPRPPWSVSLS